MENIQWGKSLWCKHEASCLDPTHSIKRSAMTAHSCVPSAREAELGEPKEVLASQLVNQ